MADLFLSSLIQLLFKAVTHISKKNLRLLLAGLEKNSSCLPLEKGCTHGRLSQIVDTHKVGYIQKKLYIYNVLISKRWDTIEST